MRGSALKIFLALTLATLFCLDASAQFKEEAFTQSYNNDETSQSDSVETMFSIKEYWGGIRHKNELKIGTSFAGSMVLIGGQQIYNKDYWKLPIIYGGIAAGAGSGAYFLSKDNKKAATLCFAGAGLVYWGALFDGVTSYKPADYPNPGRATIYSILCPGLGQIYNHELWKTPIYIGGLIGTAHFYMLNRQNYIRYRNIYIESSEPGYQGQISGQTALYYRNVYRRYRDYSMLAFFAVYLLQVMDANVFAYMHDFEVTNDLALSVSPTLITPDYQFASAGGYANSAVGMRLGLRF